MIKGIIVEGSDCSGKTTLIKALKKRLGWHVINLGHEPGNQFDRYLAAYTHSNKAIFDRGHFSEMVYGDLWRGGHGMSEQECSLLGEYAVTDFLVIFAHAPEEILKKRYALRSYEQIVGTDELAIYKWRKPDEAAVAAKTGVPKEI